MSRSGWCFLLVGLIFGAAISKAAPPDSSQLPNIVLILADDLGYGDLGFNGCPDFDTPNIDALVASGVHITNGYVSHPFCSPSRAGLLTGRYQQRFGYENNPTPDADDDDRLGLPLTEILLPSLLKPAGYVCGAYGKWHLGNSPTFHPLSRGFDEFYGFLGGQSVYENAIVLDGYVPVVEPEYLTDGFTREAESFIDRHAGTPFFLYLAYNAPHSPNDAPQQYLDRVPNITDPQRKTQAAMIVALDDGIGGVIQSLNSHNLLSNTLIIFLSDNGAPNETYVRNTPFRGYKFDTLEGGIHVPFTMRWDGHFSAGMVYDPPVSSLDLVPTIAAAAGVTLPTDRVYDGVNLAPIFQGQQTMPNRTLFWRWFGLGPTGPVGSANTLLAARNGSLKLVVESAASSSPPALYNLAADLGETQNLAASDPTDVASLSQSYANWTLDMLAPFFQFNSPFLTNFPETMSLAGDWNEYGITDTEPPWGLSFVTAPGPDGTPDGLNWFSGIIHVAASGGDTVPGTHQFAFIGGKTYSDQWGGGTIAIDAVTTLPFYKGTALGPLSSITLASNYYYSFRVLEPVVQPSLTLNVAVMKTSTPPVTLSRVSQSPAMPLPGDPIIVTVSTSQGKSAEEKLFLRWTTDTYLTSKLIPLTEAGPIYTATIPGQPADTSVQYTAVSSTVDLSPLTTAGSIDPLLLATTDSFHATIRATPTPTPSPTPNGFPTITQQPENDLVRLGRSGKFQVGASGRALHFQWRKNGNNIAGANRATYKTPPTTAGDNGAVFDCQVSNQLGEVTSAGAILTLK